MITNEKGIVLATYFADCVPLYMVDTKNKAIGLSHSGWRGTCLLYTSDAADDLLCVDLGGRRIIKKKKHTKKKKKQLRKTTKTPRKT